MVNWEVELSTCLVLLDKMMGNSNLSNNYNFFFKQILFLITDAYKNIFVTFIFIGRIVLQKSFFLFIRQNVTDLTGTLRRCVHSLAKLVCTD